MKSHTLAAALCIAFCGVALPKKAHSAPILSCNDFKKMGNVVPGVSRPVLDQGAVDTAAVYVADSIAQCAK